MFRKLYQNKVLEFYYFSIRTGWIHVYICCNDVKKSARNFAVRIYFFLNIEEGDIKQWGYYVCMYV
jgi:hypothetical protein